MEQVAGVPQEGHRGLEISRGFLVNLQRISEISKVEFFKQLQFLIFLGRARAKICPNEGHEKATNRKQSVRNCLPTETLLFINKYLSNLPILLPICN